MLLAYVTRMIYWKASTGQNTNKGEFSSQSAVYKFVEYQLACGSEGCLVVVVFSSVCVCVCGSEGVLKSTPCNTACKQLCSF